MHDRLLCWSYVLGQLLSRPVRFDPDATLELHTLVGHRTLPLYLFAARSFGRYLPEARAVAHDDGTLTRLDRALLRRCVRGLALIRKATADALVERRLAHCPALLKARRQNVRLCQLVDYCALSSAERIVGADADVLLLARPERVLAWAGAEAGAESILYSPERDPKGPHWVPRLLPDTPYAPDLCCGFACIRVADFFEPEALERLVAQLPPAVLARRRFITQMLYSLMAARDGQRAASLGPLYASGRLRWLPPERRRVICHYFASHERSDASQNLREEGELFAPLAGPLPRLVERWQRRPARPAAGTP